MIKTVYRSVVGAVVFGVTTCSIWAVADASSPPAMHREVVSALRDIARAVDTRGVVRAIERIECGK